MMILRTVQSGRNYTITWPLCAFSLVVKGELQPKIKFLFYIWKYESWLKQKVMFFFDTCNAVAAREDRKPKYWRLRRRHLGLSLMLWRHNVKRDILNMACNCWFPCSCVYWSLVKARKIVWESQVIDSSSTTQSEALWVWRCDVTTSNSIQDGGALVVNILVFDLRVQLQHCTYQRKTLLFALFKVITFICQRQILGCWGRLYKGRMALSTG